MTGSPILFCYDGSLGAGRAIAAAGALFGRREAVVLDVGPLELVAESYAAMGSGAADTRDAVYEDSVRRAEAGAELARAAGFDASARGEVDAPVWKSVLETADEIDAAVIVVGSEGRTGLRELLYGSTSHAVAAHARRPVLVVPPAEPGAHRRSAA